MLSSSIRSLGSASQTTSTRSTAPSTRGPRPCGPTRPTRSCGGRRATQETSWRTSRSIGIRRSTRSSRTPKAAGGSRSRTCGSPVRTTCGGLGRPRPSPTASRCALMEPIRSPGPPAIAPPSPRLASGKTVARVAGTSSQSRLAGSSRSTSSFRRVGTGSTWRPRTVRTCPGATAARRPSPRSIGIQSALTFPARQATPSGCPRFTSTRESLTTRAGTMYSPMGRTIFMLIFYQAGTPRSCRGCWMNARTRAMRRARTFFARTTWNSGASQRWKGSRKTTTSTFGRACCPSSRQRWMREGWLRRRRWME
mmetsp:Transcript_6183/g.15247  ORF Transcript_6183/g.15247 Transcript_6183/m.15247 type:complete len:309 (+) Transcript_6183:205-1131(+)